MTPEVFRQAVSELRKEGCEVSYLVTNPEEIRNLLGEEVFQQAEETLEAEPDLEFEVGEVDGVSVRATATMNPYFIVVTDGQVGKDSRYFYAAGDVLTWVRPDPVGVLMEGCGFEGWRPTWIRLPVSFRVHVREESGVDVGVGRQGHLMVFEGNAEKVRVVMFDDDGLSAAWLATLPVGSGPLDEVLEQIRDHVGWKGHRKLRVEFRSHHGIEGWVSRVVCDGCGWAAEVSELVGVAADRWDLVEARGLRAEADRLSQTPIYERPTVWGRLSDEEML